MLAISFFVLYTCTIVECHASSEIETCDCNLVNLVYCDIDYTSFWQLLN